MKSILRLGSFCLALCVLSTIEARADTLITFDDVADGTNIDSNYPGVTFSCFGAACPSVDVFARQSTAAFSPNNIVSTLHTGVAGTQDPTTGAIEVHFASPQSFVSVEDFLFQAPEGLGSSGYGYLRTFDSSLNLLGEADDLFANLNTFKLLSLSSAGNISYLLLGDVQGSNVISAFDNLCYSTSTTGCSAGDGVPTVPEPGMLAFIALALLLGAGLRKKAARYLPSQKV